MAFYLKIEDVFFISGRGLVVCGQVLEGEIRVNDKVFILRENKENLVAVVHEIEMKMKRMEKAVTGNNVGIFLRGINKKDVKVGDGLVDSIEPNEIMPIDQLVDKTERRIIIVTSNTNSYKIKDIPQYTTSRAIALFKFPPNHPVLNTAYAMADVYPDHYIPVNEFHEYFKQTKHAAFIELCASLGAKEIYIENVEINNKTLDINGDINASLYNLGLGISISRNNETNQKIAFKFSEENKSIKNYDSPWLHTEPSWRAMNNLRRNNYLQELGAEFSCVDDMGINAQLTSRIAQYGINIGGSFKEMIKIKLNYKVLFW